MKFKGCFRKILPAMLLIIMMLALMPPFTSDATGSNFTPQNILQVNANNSSSYISGDWYSLKNDSQNIRDAGCGIVSLVSAVYNLGGTIEKSEIGSVIDEVFDWAYTNKYWTGSAGTYWSMFAKADDKFGSKYGFSVSKQYGSKDSESTSLTSLVNHLKNDNGTVIAHVYGHFIVLVDYKVENGKEMLRVFDPAPGAGSNYNSIKRRNVTHAAGDWFELSVLQRDGGAKGGDGSTENIEIDGYWLVSATGEASSTAQNSTNPDDYPAPTRNLYYNGGAYAMTGSDVKWLQSVLVHLGYSLEVDGSYGPETTAAVKAFQADNGLTDDGKAGPITRPKLKEVWQKTSHTWDSGAVTKEPTQSSVGVKIYECKHCNAQKQEIIPTLSTPSAPVTKKYTIANIEFDKNIDYYISELDSSNYDPTLSNMLAALSLAAYEEDEIEEAYQGLGFTQQLSTHYITLGNFDPNFCSYAIGFKDSEYSNEKICLITVRGTDFNQLSEIVYDLDLFTSDEKHQGFYAPALVICKRISEDLKKLMPNDVKFVITGHSRGGAIGNLLAVELMEQGVNPKNVYNYNYATPDVACKANFPYYDNIFNLCNTDDAVPFLPGIICNKYVTQGADWGKFGRTIWFTKIPDKKWPFESHSMKLYLEVFNKRQDISKLPYDIKSKGSGILTKIFCPVDAVVTDKDGNKIASVIGGEVTYYNDSFGSVIIFTSGDKKIIYMDEQLEYDISLIGTDTGTMLYSVERCNLVTEEISETKTFENVALEKGKTMFSPISEVESLSDAELFVVEEDEDGKIVYTHTIATNGKEEIYAAKATFSLAEMLKEHTAEVIIISGVFIVGTMLISIFSTVGKKKKRKKPKTEADAIKDKFLNV